MIYAGNHGMEIKGPGIAFLEPTAARCRPQLKKIGRDLTRSLKDLKGIFVEDKGLTLSVHYRLSTEQKAQKMKDRVVLYLKQHSLKKDLVLTKGKKVLEIRPRTRWGKGQAVDYLIRRFEGRSKSPKYLPFYAGDDVTDEDAFRVVRRKKGITMFVGPARRVTCAEFRVKSPNEFQRFLTRLSVEINTG